MEQDLGKKLFWVSWLIYFISYIGRLNYAASMIEIGRTEGYTTTMLGTVVTALFISYGIGQLITGLIGDYFPSRILVLVGLIGCAICNLLMFSSRNYWQVLVIWGINGLMLSLIWPPIVRLYTQYMTKEYLHKSCFNIQTSVALGTCFTYLMCGMLLKVYHWRVIFLVTGVLLSIAALIWQITIRGIEEKHKINKQREDRQCNRIEESSTQEIVEKQSFIKVVIRSGLSTILIAILIMGFLKDGIMTWVPQYITDTFHTKANFSIFLTALLPLINLSGIYMIKYMNNKNNKDDLKTTALFYIVSLISLGMLILVGKNNMYIAVLLFAVVTSCMLGINTILVSILPTYFKKYNKTAFVAGLTNCITYLGSGLCGYGLGALVEGYGWQITSFILIGICLLGCIGCLMARTKWLKFKEENIE